MLVYILLEAGVFLCIFAKKNRPTVAKIFIALMVIVSAFRAESVGADVLTYKLTYGNIESIVADKIAASGSGLFYFICQVFRWLSIDFRGFLIALSVAYGVLLYLALKRTTSNILLALFFFYSQGLYLQSFCIIRQSFAIVIALIAVSFILDNPKLGKREYIFYFLINAVALGFHISAVIMMFFPLVSYWLNKVRLTRGKVLSLGMIGYVIILFLFSFVYPFVISLLPSKYARLYGTDVIKSISANLTGGLLVLLLYLIVYSAYCLYYHVLDENDKQMFGIILIFAIALATCSMVNEALGRVNLYVQALIVPVLSKSLAQNYNKANKPGVLYVLFFVLYLFLYLSRDSIGVTPYEIYF